MRSAPDIVPSRAPKASSSLDQFPPRISSPATFFLARGSSHDSHDPHDPHDSYDSYDPHDCHDPQPAQNTMYGVQSLDDAILQASGVQSECSSNVESAQGHWKLSPNLASRDNDDNVNNTDIQQKSDIQRRVDLLNLESDASSIQPPPSDSELSRPLSPLNLSNPGDMPSLPSSPKSLSSHSVRPLDDISFADDQSQLLAPDESETRDVLPVTGSDSMPQLIMPSLRMPSRRPFTDRGKAMGRLKVVIAGASGSGKTSLIKSMVQECEDIVHVDPFPALSSRRRRSFVQGSRSAVAEIYASTKPYPSWWSDLEDTRVLRRRRSAGDIVLERNLCFVDTPATSTSRAEQTDAILHYVHQQLFRAIAAIDSPNGDFQNMLAGNGGSQVDAIVFLISRDTLAADIECIRQLGNFTNVVPVIAKSDQMASDQIADLKSTFRKQAQAAGVNLFLFGDPSLAESDPFDTRVPFAISSAKSNDDEVMDASTLMSPEYVQPLVPSELKLLVENLFDRDHLAWMRHSAAKKLAQRQRAQLAIQPYVPYSPSSSVTSAPLSTPSSSSLTPALAGPLDYTLARIADHTQREERLAQVHLASWASDLQQSLQNERQRYEQMARGDRAAWLTERLSECVVDGSLVPSPGSHQLKGTNRAFHIRLSPHDPLGVVWWTDDLKHRGWVIFQVVGSFGVVGGLALWLAKFFQVRNVEAYF